MTEHFAQHFVNLSSRRLAANRAAELRLNHGEGSLYVRPLVIMSQEAFPIEVVEVPHFIPETVKLVVMVSHACRIDLERDERCPADCLDCMKVSPVRICFISRNLVDVEGLGGRVHQGGKLNVISRLIRGSFYACHNMGVHPAHQMSLNPSLFAPFLAVFVVKPSGIGGGSEARRVNCEVSLYRSQWACALFNEGFQEWSQFGGFQITGIAGERRGFGDQFLCLRFSQAGHEAPTGHGAISPVGNTENHVSQWESWPTEPVFRLRDAIAEVTEQFNKAFFLVHLSIVVSRPFLSARYLYGLRQSSRAIWLSLFLNKVLHRMNVLARLLASLKVGTGTKWMVMVKIDHIASIARLRRDFPAYGSFNYLAGLGYLQSSFFSRIHLSSPFINHLIYAYISTQYMHLSIVLGKILLRFPIDNGTQCVIGSVQMNEVQARIAQLLAKDWTKAAIADELKAHRNTVAMWEAGKRYPRPDKPVLDALDRLLQRNRIPKMKRYGKGSRRQGVSA